MKISARKKAKRQIDAIKIWSISWSKIDELDIYAAYNAACGYFAVHDWIGVEAQYLRVSKAVSVLLENQCLRSNFYKK